MAQHLLIIEDDKNIQKFLYLNLTEAGFKVLQAFNGKEGLEKAVSQKPDLIILDINLPGLNGMDVCRELKGRESTKYIPIIMLTVRKDEIDRVAGFEVGADDYVTKPFSPRELVLRVKAVLRRKDQPTVKHKVGNIILDESRFEVKIGNRPVALTSTEFKLLKYFILNKGRLISRQTLLNNVWDYPSEIETRTVDAHIKSLRKKLDSKKVRIATIIGMGYKLVER